MQTKPNYKAKTWCMGLLYHLARKWSGSTGIQMGHLIPTLLADLELTGDLGNNPNSH